MSTSTFSVRVDSDLKAEAENYLSDMGLSMSTLFAAASGGVEGEIGRSET